MMKRHTLINWQTVLLLSRYHWKFLLTAAGSGLILALIMNATMMHPTYSANAKLLLKSGKTPAYVSQVTDQDGQVQALTMNGNPILTQIEVLNSVQLAKQTLANLKSTMTRKQYQELSTRYAGYFNPHKLAKTLKLKNPANTDIVTLKLSTPDRQLSTRLVNEYILTYNDFLEEINHQTLTQRGEHIARRIGELEDELKNVREHLMQFRLANATVDIGNEASARILQMTDLETQRASLDAQISARRRNVSALRGMLGMNLKMGLESVAIGMSTALQESQKKLNTAMEEYETLSVKYTDSHPQMEALKARIAELKTQLGGSPMMSGHSLNLRISDPVRSDLVQAMATAENELQGFIAQRAALGGNISGMKQRMSLMPRQQMHLAELMEKEQVLSQMISTLRLKAAEAEIHASEGLSNVVTVESATVAPEADFPGPTHVMLLMMMAGFMGGMSWLMLMEWFKQRALSPLREQLDAPMQTPV